MVVDTSVLIESLTSTKPLYPALHRLLVRGERLAVPALVLFEWWRGPRTEAELRVQQILFPRETALAFGSAEATVAARIYRSVPSPRTREIDLAIAAHAIVRDTPLWTLNRRDFEDIPGLSLASLD